MARIVVDEVVEVYNMDSSGYVKSAGDVKRANQDITKSHSGLSGSFSDIGNSVKFAASEFDAAIPGLQEVVSVIKVAGIAIGTTVAAVAAFTAVAAHQNAELDAIRLGYQAYSDGAEDAAIKLKRLQEVARLPGLGFEEAIEGATRLRAVGFDSRLAERALMGFGNALALVGGGKAELDGVILALSQIQSKGKVSAEEINQIAERVPQIRKLMVGAFGTGDAESIAKNVSSEEFIMKIIDELEKLQKATGGSKNAFENFGDSVKRVMDQIGGAVNKVIAPAMSELANFVDFLSEIDFFGKSVNGIIANLSKLGNIGGNFLSGAGGASPIAGAIADVSKFVVAGDSFGDKLVRGASLLAATFEQLPSIIDLILDVVNQNLMAMQGLVNGVIKAFNKILTEGIKGHIGPFDLQIGGGMLGVESVKIPGFDDSAKMRASGLAGSITGRAGELYEQYKGWKPSNDVANDPSKGGFESLAAAMDRTATATEQTAANTNPLNQINNQVIGGGALAKYALNRSDVSDLRGGGGIAAHDRKLLQAIKEWSAVSNALTGQFSRREV